jgi:hypothetical protein
LRADVGPLPVVGEYSLQMRVAHERVEGQQLVV